MTDFKISKEITIQDLANRSECTLGCINSAINKGIILPYYLDGKPIFTDGMVIILKNYNVLCYQNTYRKN